MGCGTSANNETVDTDSRKDIDDLMGKKIPKFLIQPQYTTQGVQQSEMSDGEDQKNDIQGDYHRQGKKAQKKFKGGDEQNVQIVENIIKLDKTIQKSDRQMIEKSFKSHFVFFNLTQQAIDYLIKNLVFCTQKRDQFIFQQGDQATSYFIVQKGQAEVIINQKQVKVISEGEYFGEIALLYNATRSASIKTITDCNFWMLDRGTFRKAIEDMMIKEYDDNRKFINEVTFFSFMTPEQRDSIAHALITTKFEPGETIVNEGDQADSYYVIKSGTVGVFKGKKQINTMGPKDSFGEQALYEKSTRGASVRAETEVKCLALGRDNLTKILGDKVQLIIFNNIMRWSLEKSNILNQLTKLQQEKITLKAKIQNYKKGQVIFQKDTKCEQLVIVLEGTLQSDDDKIGKGNCFGDQYLSSNKKNDLLSSDYLMVTDGVLASISFTQMFKILGGDFETAIQKKFESHEVKIKNIANRADASHIRVEDLVFIKKLGSGQFGWVYLVKHKDIDSCYALKSVSKASIVEQSLERHVLQEKMVLELCNFPFVMQFVRTFKDEISVYFLVQYIRGMELFDVIREIGLLNKEQTQFYVGTMILCLEYLHSNGIVYRDLKPENIMVNSDGIMILIDLGTAKQISKAKGQRTYTIIGTPHYMAPEIILGKGYSYHVDLWSVGICCYEFLCGGVPYAEDIEDPYEIYEEIMNNQLKFPHFFRDRSAKRYIEQLLSKQPEARLGTSYAGLKAHAWFDDFDWDKLFSHQLQPPYIPPKERLIGDFEIDKKFQQGKLVVQEIKAEQQQQKIKYRKELAKDPNWDKSF
ncbi:unnamed protein product [Paramecium primaurelia]|uniref:cGMP-dependent protein kinase n=1 Tax=Paramecium primaurelia TaxID=5886 RepID=A0A8S1JSS6_PARPR|nr:unnamed protein product [Paramecium primaurelia]